MDGPFSGNLFKAGRALVGWNQSDLAAAANVGKQTVADFERGARVPIRNNLSAMVSALEDAGVEFLSENGSAVGVRLNTEQIADNPSQERFRQGKP